MNQTQNTFGRSDFSAGLQKAQEDIQNTQRDLGFFFAEQHAPQVAVLRVEALIQHLPKLNRLILAAAAKMQPRREFAH